MAQRGLTARANACPACGKTMSLQSPHVAIHRTGVVVYCSRECKTQPDRVTQQVDVEPPRRNRRRLVLLSLLLASTVVLLGVRLRDEKPPATVVRAKPPSRAQLPTLSLKAVANASSHAIKSRASLWSAELTRDLWVHPLAGPVRRMPVRDSRVFGAERPGGRPVECFSGHCGVDIGGEVWGEPVLASHDGVVARVQRKPNPDHGGHYVRLSHRNDTVFTQYFHLAAIPPGLHVGDKVLAGDVIGLVGATGVTQSGPHLHFTISVRPSPEEAEQYIDPEPLIALWPVALPIYGRSLSVPSSHIVPGVPRVASRRQRSRRAKRKSSRPETLEATGPAPDPVKTPASASAASSLPAAPAEP